MACDEHLVDFVHGLPAVARRMAGPQRRQELHLWRGLPPLPPAGETLGLARQILERGFEGLEPAAEALGVDEAIGRRRGFNHRPGCWPQGRHPGIGPEEMDARLHPRELPVAQAFEILARIAKLKGGA